jgi:trimethylamine corrinoid protein
MGEAVERIYRSVLGYEVEQVTSLVRDALACGVDPIEIMEEGLTRAIVEIGDRFGREEIFLVELMLAAKCCQEGMELVKRALAASKVEVLEPRGVIVIGTVKGDIHNIGKDIVRTLLETAGFAVHDIGVDQPPESFAQRAREVKARIVASSALLTTTCPFQKEIESKLREVGLRQQVRTIIGGAATSAAWAREVGCDYYAPTATEGVKIIRRFFEGGRQ